MADDAECSTRTIQRGIDELVEKGLVSVVRWGNQHQTTRYRLNGSVSYAQIPASAPDNMSHAPSVTGGSAIPVIQTTKEPLESSASLDHPSDDLSQPLPLAAFKDAVIAYLAAHKGNRVSALVRIGDSLGYERNGGFAA
ncbi:hypothetical protein LCGC14_3110740, partial [marine sediment metagenome]